MDAIFGMEFPLLVKFVISFAVVLVLIGAAAFVVRRFGAKGLAKVVQRGRQQRLAVVDTAQIDARRSLVIVRRDNVEHLLLIGGPTDVLVEANIAPAVAVQPARETEPSVRLARVVPEAAASPPANAPWPPATPAEPPRIEPVAKAEPRVESRPEPVFLPEQRIEPAVRIQQVPAFPSAAENPSPPVQVAARAADVAHRPASVPAQDFEAARNQINGLPAHPRAAEHVTAPQTVATPQSRAAEPAFNDDQNLADMAQRLETALRRPIAVNQARAAPAHEALRPVPTAVRPAPEPSRPAPEPVVAPPPVAAPPLAAPQPAGPGANAQAQTDAATYESLQREMASLLGRKPGSS